MLHLQEALTQSHEFNHIQTLQLRDSFKFVAKVNPWSKIARSHPYRYSLTNYPIDLRIKPKGKLTRSLIYQSISSKSNLSRLSIVCHQHRTKISRCTAPLYSTAWQVSTPRSSNSSHPRQWTGLQQFSTNQQHLRERKDNCNKKESHVPLIS